MSSISKTARQAMEAGSTRGAKADPFDTPEKKIAELIKQRDAKLAVVRYDFIDALIFKYEEALSTIVALTVDKDVLEADLSLKMSEIANLKATGNSEGTVGL